LPSSVNPRPLAQREGATLQLTLDHGLKIEDKVLLKRKALAIKK
jgi:hypothetical protein